ncbi:MAG TPA: energy transducer TonB, partial [Gammaproteobacteria bacterium]
MYLRIIAAVAMLGLITACNPMVQADNQAFDEMKAKAEAGDPAAERELARRYLWGQGVKADAAESAKWLELAAQGGDTTAQLELGKFYTRGTGVAKDPVRAHQLFLQAAVQNSEAQGIVGYDYLMGVGTPVDYGQAMSWLKKAAAAGDVNAPVSLGYMYASGLGTPKDEAAAMDWYKQAAARGSRISQLYLAGAYAQGLNGVTVDQATSDGYFAQAAQGMVKSYPELGEAMKQIIDAHAHLDYPADAIKAGQAGITKLEFDCEDRKAGNVKVTQSSGFPALDAAASRAVVDSTFPFRGPALKGIKHFAIGVDFQPSPPEAPAAAK